MYTLLLLVEITIPNKYVFAFAPLALFIIAMYIYWPRISNNDYNQTFKDKKLWNAVLTFLPPTIIIQAAANIISQQIFHLTPPDISKYLLIIAPTISIFCSSIIEEIVFRRIIFKAINLKLNFWYSAIISSILFAICHGNYAGWLGLFFVGVLWSWIYYKTQNIMVPIILHILLNTIALSVTTLSF